jgi:hypothetical protein
VYGYARGRRSTPAHPRLTIWLNESLRARLESAGTGWRDQAKRIFHSFLWITLLVISS